MPTPETHPQVIPRAERLENQPLGDGEPSTTQWLIPLTVKYLHLTSSLNLSSFNSQPRLRIDLPLLDGRAPDLIFVPR